MTGRAVEELEADADVLWLGLLEDGDVGDDEEAELPVTAGVVAGAVWLWVPADPEAVPELLAGWLARANASAAPPAPTRMASTGMITNRAERRGPGRLSGAAARTCGACWACGTCGTCGTCWAAAGACGGTTGV